MPSRRPTRSARHYARASRQANTLTPSQLSGRSRYSGGMHVGARHHAVDVRRRERGRRLRVVVIAVVIVLAVAALAGFLAYRGSLGSEMSLKNSDAPDALVSVKSGEPYYALIAAELGAVAEPLEQTGPDVLLLAHVDREAHTLALVAIPPGLQVTTNGVTSRVGDLAQTGDAALIEAISTFAKVNISHYVKVEEGGVPGIVDALDGIEVNIDQVIDDPHAGDVYLPVGAYTLNGVSALTYLRADNLKLGVADQLEHQVTFAAQLLSKLFGSEGNFAARLDSFGPYFQTDLSLGDLEALQEWMKNLSPSDITCVSLPGYLTAVTGVVDTGDSMFVAKADDMASIISALEAGKTPDTTISTDITAADPASFTVEVQNGTEIVGAGAVTGDSLTAAGFNVVKVGNAEQQVYDETLVVYKGDEGPSRAKAVIDALGVGRAVEGDVYYKFDSDILVIIGSDYKPTS